MYALIDVSMIFDVGRSHFISSDLFMLVCRFCFESNRKMGDGDMDFVPCEGMGHRLEHNGAIVAGIPPTMDIIDVEHDEVDDKLAERGAANAVLIAGLDEYRVLSTGWLQLEKLDMMAAIRIRNAQEDIAWFQSSVLANMGADYAARADKISDKFRELNEVMEKIYGVAEPKRRRISSKQPDPNIDIV